MPVRLSPLTLGSHELGLDPVAVVDITCSRHHERCLTTFTGAGARRPCPLPCLPESFIQGIGRPHLPYDLPASDGLPSLPRLPLLRKKPNFQSSPYTHLYALVESLPLNAR